MGASSKKVTLSAGAIADIVNGKNLNNVSLQILNLKKIPAQGSEKYRVIISDGVHHYTSCILNSAYNDKVASNEISVNCVIKVTRYSATFQSGKTIVVINELDVLASGEEQGGPIGSTTKFTPAETENINPYSKNTSSSKADDGSSPKKSKNEVHSIASHNQAVDSPSKKVHPITSLTPYQNRWTIKARCSSKSSIRTYSNSRGSGKLFNIVLIDETSEIRATFYNEECDAFYPQIEAGNVYQISQCSIKPANRQYSSVNNDYELVATPDSQFFLCENDSSIPKMDFNFTKIENMSQTIVNTLVDFVAVVVECGELATITTKQGKELTKRELQVGDETGYKIRVTLWEKEARDFEESNLASVIAVKNARVGDFGGRSLSTTFDSQIMVNPDMTEVYTLKGWYSRVSKDNFEFKDFKNVDRGDSATSSGKFMTLNELKRSMSTDSDTANYGTVMVYLSQVRYNERGLYKACPECKKKLVPNDNEELFCEKCSKVQQDFKWNLIMSVELVDSTDSSWATSFAESCEVMIGKSVSEIGALKDQAEQEGSQDIESILQTNIFKPFLVNLKIQMEIYNDESRPKVSVLSCKSYNPIAYARKLIQEINAMKL